MLLVLVESRPLFPLATGMFEKLLHTIFLLCLCLKMTELCIIANLRLFYHVTHRTSLEIFLNLCVLWHLTASVCQPCFLNELYFLILVQYTHAIYKLLLGRGKQSKGLEKAALSVNLWSGGSGMWKQTWRGAVRRRTALCKQVGEVGFVEPNCHCVVLPWVDSSYFW